MAAGRDVEGLMEAHAGATTFAHGDDRILPATRLVALVVAPVLAAAGVILYLFPAQTARLWSWPMRPPMTALAVGGGYLAGAVFFARAAGETRWHAISVTFLGASVLSGLLLVATVLHWDLFTHGHVAFWAWLLLYAVTPWLLPLVWLRNQRHGRSDGGDAAIVPRRIRAFVGTAGVVLLAVAAAFFAEPQLAVASWPWTLTPLTARTLSAFLAFIAVVWLAFLWEDRWSGLRLHVESATLGLALVGLGVLRSPEDVTGQPVATALFAAALTTGVLGMAGLQLYMWRRSRPSSTG